LQQVFDKFKAQGFQVVTINMLTSQETGAVKIMSKYTFTALKNPGEGWSWGQKTYGVQGTPTSFLLDPEGKIIFKVPGLESVSSDQQAEAEIAGLLKWTETPEYARARAQRSAVAATAPASAKANHKR
jgi:hypothetical protein